MFKKGKIDSSGNLHIFRGNELKRQACNDSADCSYCGDWCSLFDEPEFQEKWGFFANVTALSICEGRVLLFAEFVDERPTE